MNAVALRELFDQALVIWRQGGWGMNALAVNGFIMFTMGGTILLRLLACGAGQAADRAWAAWRRAPDRPQGRIGRLIADVMQWPDEAGVARHFEAARNELMAPFERDLRVLQVSVKAAPLLGLLGTVTGMLSTFRALATGGTADKTMEMIASGISEALVTTETGLVMALVGLMVQMALRRRFQAFGKLLAHLETLCMQHLRRTAAPAPLPAAPAIREVPAAAGAFS